MKTLSSSILFEHNRFKVKEDEVFINGNTNIYTYIDKPNAVGIIPVVDGKVWLVDQYRHSTGIRLLEIPGGRIDGYEKPIDAAVRELREETGLLAKNIKHFASIYVHPSLCNEEIHIFIASEFEEYSPILDKSESDLTIKKVTVSELKELLLNNEIPAAPDGYMLSLYLLKINEI